MRTVVIGPNEAGQRLDKFLRKYMKDAPPSFFYKMMRKKNIVLNRSRCEGSQILQEGDELKLFLSEETLAQFGAAGDKPKETDAEALRAYRQLGPLEILYEDADILAVNKPAGVLSQKSAGDTVSLNEWLIGYLSDSGSLGPGDAFQPSVCNRLDRNTGGIVLCGRSLAGLQLLSQLLRERRIDKEYRLIALGGIREAAEATAWLVKDAEKNQVRISDRPLPGTQQIRTGITPIGRRFLPGIGKATAAQAKLYTGKTHQIRAQMAALSHPLLGDPKYGDPKANAAVRNGYGLKSQALHAWRVRFPEDLPERFGHLAGKEIIAPPPGPFAALWDALARADGGM